MKSCMSQAAFYDTRKIKIYTSIHKCAIIIQLEE